VVKEIKEVVNKPVIAPVVNEAKNLTVEVKPNQEKKSKKANKRKSRKN
jgi:hypothetical protein